MLLATAMVFPSYGQVKVADHRTVEEIQWEDSLVERGYLAGEHVLLIRTREPGDGDVTIELHDQVPGNCGTLIYDGPLTFDSGALSISGVDEDSQVTHRFRAAGTRQVQVYVDHTDDAGRVVVVVG